MFTVELQLRHMPSWIERLLNDPERENRLADDVQRRKEDIHRPEGQRLDHEQEVSQRISNPEEQKNVALGYMRGLHFFGGHQDDHEQEGHEQKADHKQ